jgi:predicted permease
MPDWKTEILARLAGLNLDPAREAAIVEEISQHLDDRFVELQAGGAPAEEATQAALAELSGGKLLETELRRVERPKAPGPEVLAQTRGNILDNLFQDLRYAARRLAKSPVFTAVAILSLAVGIGAGTAVFSLCNGVLLSSLPVPNPQQLRVIQWSGTEANIPDYFGDDYGSPHCGSFSFPGFCALREQSSAQADLFGFAPVHSVTARARRQAFITEGLLVSDNFFAGLGVRPLLGRVLDAQDERAGAGPAIVLSHQLWERQFDSDPGAIGQSIMLNGHNFTVVGVLPRGFPGVHPGAGTEFYASVTAQPQLAPVWPSATSERWWWVKLMARMKPGARDGQFQETLNLAFARGAQTFMKQPKVLLADGRAGPDRERNLLRKPLLLLLGIGGVVLLVVCANLAGLMLARGADHHHEFAVRAALGADRRRLARQSLTESVLVAILGGGLGVAIAVWGRAALSRLLADSTEGLKYDTSLNLTVLGFALALSLLAASISGLLPALRAAAVDPLDGLKKRDGFGRDRLGAGRLLVVAQIAFSLVLLGGAGLYIHTLVNIAKINPGFATENLLLFQLNPGNAGYPEARTAAFYTRVQESLAAIPGVQSAALTLFPLLSGSSGGETFTMPGHSPDGQPEFRPNVLIVGETFFTTMGIPALLGRELQATDTEGTAHVVVVNETFARKYLPGETPIGNTMKRNGQEWQIVGVCRDTRYADIKEGAPPVVYFSYRQHPSGSAYFALRTASSPPAVVAAARKAVAAIDPNIPLTNFETQEQVRNNAFLVERVFAGLCGSLAALAVLLSCAGLYGLMAYHVSRRTREIGIRIAVGATRRQIGGSILREALTLVGAGVVIGLPLTLALSRLIRANLYGVAPYDPATLGGGVLLIAVVALAAAWIPARRAAGLDPKMALRCE